MRKYIKDISRTPHGKKFLMSLKYNCQANLGDKSILCEYLHARLKGVDKDISTQQGSFIYRGELMSMLPFVSFKKWYLKENEKIVERFSTKRITSKYTNEQVKEKIEKWVPDDGQKLGKNYVWVTNYDENIHPLDLGLEKPYSEHMVAIRLPKSEYELLYSSVVEGYSYDDIDGKNIWFYGNSDLRNNWGCTVDVDKLQNPAQCTESSIKGENEALLQSCLFPRATSVEYVGYIPLTKTEYDERYQVLLDTIEKVFDTTVVDEILSICKEVEDECK